MNKMLVQGLIFATALVGCAQNPDVPAQSNATTLSEEAADVCDCDAEAADNIEDNNSKDVLPNMEDDRPVHAKENSESEEEVEVEDDEFDEVETGTVTVSVDNFLSDYSVVISKTDDKQVSETDAASEGEVSEDEAVAASTNNVSDVNDADNVISDGTEDTVVINAARLNPPIAPANTSQTEESSEVSASTTNGCPPVNPEKSTYTVDEANKLENELIADVEYQAVRGGYPIVDTNQTLFYSNDAIIAEPKAGEAFYGQDAQFTKNAPSYTDNGDGTISDNVTGLMWKQDPGEKMTWPEAIVQLKKMNQQEFAGFSDWRIPSIKEVFSLVDASGVTRMSAESSIPYINTEYFVFEYGDTSGDNCFIDSQILSSTIYDTHTMNKTTAVFGYNFADGRVKGYEIDRDFYCYFVRANPSYGLNLFIDNANGTITDDATHLMWMQNDSGFYKVGANKDGAMNWEEALAWAQQMNAENFLGYSDWRLPNIKELHSLVDYTKSPKVTETAAINDLFYCTKIINAFDEEDYGYYWSSTTHDDIRASEAEYNAASYVIFGKALGLMNNNVMDVHGSGSQRSDPKSGERSAYPAPDMNSVSGDEQRVYNMVRLVRDTH
ncbi:MAG: hypothetical protein ATN34_02575 [Epulopiscium sp. Nele67-Bin002]|nr:MAG: hypothetical protein ATN34_02575 [Epulopiscium sp. Nele67-Bin002]